jgi:2,3-dihydroxy-p-cumate/2,3-dihydroxybenzoate 3,4-dioxygenase
MAEAFPPPTFRYRGLAGVTLNVTDLRRSVAFYQDMVGLELIAQSATHAVFRCSARHHDVILHADSRPGLKRVAFELESASDFEAAQAHFKALGHALKVVDEGECARLHQQAAFRLREPSSGLEFEFLVGAGASDHEVRAGVAKLVRVGHVVIEVTDLAAVLGFLVDRANFRTSDFVEGRIHFLRCFPNPLHHSFAVQQGAENRLHHVNFMVSDIDDIGRGMNRMRKAEVEIVFGPGRHEPSGSIFLYFLDPDRMTLEYSFGMEEFAEVDPRRARSLEAKPEVLDIWGSVPTPNFAKVGTIEAPHG